MQNVIQGLWIGSRLSTMEVLSIASFLEHGHPYHLYCYDELDRIPPGVVVCDANAILPATQIFKDQAGSLGSFADFFRYKLLLERGGWWADLDQVCLKKFSFENEYVISSEFYSTNGKVQINNGVIKAPKGCEMIRYLWEQCLLKNISEIKFRDAGPKLIEQAVERFKLENAVVDPTVFCPVPSTRLFELLVPGREIKVGPYSRGIHLWGELWRCNGLPKDEQYAPNCLFERLKRAFLSNDVRRRSRAKAELYGTEPTFRFRA